MRGIAALAVMLVHYRGALYEGYWRAFSNTGAAVDFFFVLSGFVLCHAYGGKILHGMRAADYLARRVARLFPLLALGLLIGAPSFYLLSVVGTGAGYSLHNMLVMLLCNVFFVPYLGQWGAAKAIFPMDHALWSI